MAMILCSYFLASYIYLGNPLAPGQLVDFRLLSWHDSAILFLVGYSLVLVLGYAGTRVFGSIYLGLIRKMAKSVVAINTIGLILFMSSFYIVNLDDASRVLVFLFYVFSTFFVCFANWIAIHLFRIRRNSQKFRRNVLVIGCGHLASEYAKAVAERSSRPEHVIGFIDPNLDPYAPFDINEHRKEHLGSCLGSIWNIEYVFQSCQIDEIVLALDIEDYSCVRQAVAAADRHGVSLTLVPFYNDIIPRKPNIDSFGGINLVDLRSMPLSNPLYASIKRFSDIVVSLFVIIITSWLMVIVAIGVKLSSPGPVFFKQLRMGRYNKPFEMLKFRSMAVNETSDVAWSTNEDPRKTRFGSFIRKYSIDELPQFFNVLKGDMSIVGPRPEIPFYVQQFSQNIPLYMLRHQVRPGITGLAQINGLRGDTSIADRIESDLFYIQHWSYWLDVKIFFKTLFGGFVNDEALVEGNLSSKFAKTKLGRIGTSINESAIDGSLGKFYIGVYLLGVFLYVFLCIYVNPNQVIIPGISVKTACSMIEILPYILLITGVVCWITEARKLAFWFIAIISWILLDLIIVNSGVKQLIAIYAFVFAYPKNLKINKVAGTVFLASALAILVIAASCIAGIIPDHIGGIRAGLERHSMGFISANAFSTAVTACLIPYVYYRLRNWSWIDVVFCLLVGISSFYISGGRMSLLMLLLLVVLACMCRFETIKNALSAISPWVVVGCFFISLFIVSMYWHGQETALSNTLNHLLSRRPEFISSFLDEYSIKLFGQKIATISMANVYDNPGLIWRGIDSSYINILLRFGIVGTAIFILPTIWYGINARKNGYFAAIFVMVIIALFSMTENFLYVPTENLTIFILGYFVGAWANKKKLPIESASAPIDRSVDWVNMKNSRWKDFLIEE